MTPREFERALGELRRGPGPARVRMLAAEIREALGQPWVDARMAREAQALLISHGQQSGPDWRPVPLRVGETWLLLYEVSWGGALIGRLRWAGNVGAAGNTVFAADARRHVETALRGLLATVAAAGRSLSERVDTDGFEVLLSVPRAEIVGASLGLGVCVAVLSHALGRAPGMHVAATARVRADGSLGRVDHVGEKILALRERWPCVRTVVVARGQTIEGPMPDGVEVVERATVAEALRDFELSLEGLPCCELEVRLAEFERLKVENTRSHGAKEWAELACRAWEVSRALAVDPHERHRAAEAAVWAALFTLHSGDPSGAEDYLNAVPDTEEERLPIFARAWKQVVAASASIDRDPAMAVERAVRAVETSRVLQGDEARIHGYALGTYGRALMHAGRLAESEGPLREAVEIMERVAPHEVARSRNYLATCLRMQGRLAEALAEVERAVAVCDRYPARALSMTTRMYLELERGRCLLALGRAHEAVDAFQRVQRQQGSDGDYPRLGAVRGLAAGYRALGRRNEADEALRRCLRVVETVQGIRRQVAVMAIGDALLEDTTATSVSREELERAWREVFPRVIDRDAIRERVAKWVY